MPLFKQVCVKSHTSGGREFEKGQLVRTVSISERDAEIMNGLNPDGGKLFEYVKVEDVKVEDGKQEPTKKEIRDALIAKATELKLEFKKNISTPDLQVLVEKNTPAN